MRYFWTRLLLLSCCKITIMVVEERREGDEADGAMMSFHSLENSTCLTALQVRNTELPSQNRVPTESWLASPLGSPGSPWSLNFALKFSFVSNLVFLKLLFWGEFEEATISFTPVSTSISSSLVFFFQQTRSTTSAIWQWYEVNVVTFHTQYSCKVWKTSETNCRQSSVNWSLKSIKRNFTFVLSLWTKFQFGSTELQSSVGRVSVGAVRVRLSGATGDPRRAEFKLEPRTEWMTSQKPNTPSHNKPPKESS